MLIPILLFLLTIGGSVVPSVESFEQIETLPKEKYTKKQFAEIEKALARKEDLIRVMTYNVLFDLFEDRELPENSWKNRFPRVVDLIESTSPDILGVQELYKNQAADLLSKLGDTYAFVSRDPTIGETNGIFYRKDRFLLMCKEIIDTPYESKIRISDHLTYVVLKDCKTGKEFALVNGHLAFRDPNKREEQIEKMGQIGACQKVPVILMGDFNTFSARPEFGKMPFQDGDFLQRILSGYGLKDAREISLLGHVGPIATFTNEESDIGPFKGRGTPGIMFDHLYVSKGVTVLIHAVEPAQVDGHFPSDHMPVFADLIID